MSAVPGRGRTRALAVAGFGVGVLVVVLLGSGVALGWSPQLRVDDAVSRALYVGDDRPALLGGLLQVLTAPGTSAARVLVFAPVLGWLLLRRRGSTAGWVGLAVLAIGPVTAALKVLVGRVRPDFAGGGARYDSLSFPSGHSSGIACLVTTALVLGWPWLTPAGRRAGLVTGVGLVVLVGLTRMWLGVHYLSDVLAGWALGVAWTLLVALAFGGLPGGPAALPGRGLR